MKNLLLPEYAVEFLQLIETTSRPATVIAYKCSLRKFYSYLFSKKLTIHTVDRRHIEIWLKKLKGQGLAAVSRSSCLIMVRMHLRWLYENERLPIRPEKLIRDHDLPKTPKLLPKPFSPEMDNKIQEKLRKMDHPHYKGLLLMRKTGLRIGELAALSYDCLLIDRHKRAFLKVPLGKLHNERMVPLDEEALKLIRHLQRVAKQMSKKPSHLIRSRAAKRVHPNTFSYRFHNLVKDFPRQGDERINSHRLRHTYATELLNAGMSLVSVMHLLGHSKISSTLKYAAVSQHTIYNEYHKACDTLKATTYSSLTQKLEPQVPNSQTQPSVYHAMGDAMALLKKSQCQLPKTTQKKVILILSRMRRMRSEIQKMVGEEI